VKTSRRQGRCVSRKPAPRKAIAPTGLAQATLRLPAQGVVTVVAKPGSPHGSGPGVFSRVSNAPWPGCIASRLALRYERRADVHEAFLTLGCALITWRYLKREY